jgi:hypothetical protein
MSYKFSDSKPVLVYEVFLPKKMSYASKLAEVLDAFLSDAGTRSIPAVQKKLNQLATDAERDKFVKRIRETIRGYSIYEVDGRFGTDTEPIDERTWVIRFIIDDPQVEGGIRGNFFSLAKEVIEFLVARRFAEELGKEMEIWFLEYEHCRLRKWIKEEDIPNQASEVTARKLAEPQG